MLLLLLPLLLAAAPALAGPPPRPAGADGVTQVHVAFSNHVDLGFDGIDPELGLDSNVINRYFDVYFPRAIATAEALRRRAGPVSPSSGPFRRFGDD